MNSLIHTREIRRSRPIFTLRSSLALTRLGTRVSDQHRPDIYFPAKVNSEATCGLIIHRSTFPIGRSCTEIVSSKGVNKVVL